MWGWCLLVSRAREPAHRCAGRRRRQRSERLLVRWPEGSHRRLAQGHTGRAHVRRGARLVPTPAAIAAVLKAVGDALPLAEGGDAIPVANLRGAADTLHATWTLVTKFCEVALRSVPIDHIPAILAQIQMTASGSGHNLTPKPPINAKQLASGVIRIDVLALAAVVAYFYEFSVDQTTWLPGIQTGRTDGTISGLKPGTLYYFRFRCLKTDDTYTDYSEVTNLLVH
jgi:hypothetical protein